MRVLFAPERDARVFRDSDNHLADTVKHNLVLSLPKRLPKPLGQPLYLFTVRSGKPLIDVVAPATIPFSGQSSRHVAILGYVEACLMAKLYWHRAVLDFSEIYHQFLAESYS
jgi:hypothetical protein